MSNCQDYIIKMNQYLDGELPVDEISELLRHMEECAECRKVYENLKIVAFETRHLRADAPRQLHANIMNAVARERPMRRMRRLNRLSHLAALAACGALLIVMVNTVAPWLREKPIFGGSSDYSGGGGNDMNMAPQTAESAPEDAGGAEWSLADDSDSNMAMPAAAPDHALMARAQNGEQEDGEENAEPDAPSGGETGVTQPGTLMQTSGYDHDLFTVPELRASELVAWYIIATGTGDPSELFPMESVIGERELGETYIFVPNTDSEKEAAIQTLIDAGFTLHDNVDNLPAVDETAEYGLIVVFESR